MPVFALVDCNSFYASCEQVFNPKVWGKPVVVLSNNDGNIIARSKEAKAVGIGMAKPFFEIRDELEQNGVFVFSSNYALYGDMSNRVRKVLFRFSPHVELYSIDECFLDLSGFDQAKLTANGQTIKQTIETCTHIPVSVGIGATKSLAKIANKVAKKSAKANGVVNLYGSPHIDQALQSVPVGDIWGVGQAYEEFFRNMGAATAYAFKKMPDYQVRKRMGVVGARILMELNGVSCLPLEEVPQPKKMIGSQKGFGILVEDKEQLQEAMTAYVTRTAEKAREQKLAVVSMLMWVSTDPFRKQDPQYAESILYTLPEPTNYTPTLVRFGNKGIDLLYKPGYKYKRVGVQYTELVPAGETQQNLFWRPNTVRQNTLMAAVDQINGKLGRGTLRMAAEGFDHPWSTRFQYKSPRYTTCWEELPVAFAF